jgi:hypothetical protein
VDLNLNKKNMGNIKALRYAINCRNIVEKELDVDFKNTSRVRRNSYARIIYTKLINERYIIDQPATYKLKGLKQEHIAKLTNRDRSTVSYYLTRFNDLINYDDFKEMYMNVRVVWNSIYSRTNHISSGEFWLRVGNLC